MHFPKSPLIVALVLGTALVMPQAQAQDGVVATVNGVAIPQSRLEYVIKAQVAQGQKDNEELRKNIREALITREILGQEAARRGLEKNPEVLGQLEMAKQEFLIRALFDDAAKKMPVTDDAAKAEYEKVKALQTDNGKKVEYHARHILIKDEKKAKATLAAIHKDKGKTFEKIAKEKSEDTASKVDGGLLDWTDGSSLVKEFTAAMVKLQKGETTKDLVKTKFGYHIIKLEDTRPMEFPPFDQVKDKVNQELARKTREQMVEEIRAKAEIK